MNTDMIVNAWPDLLHLLRRREALWKQARLHRASTAPEEPLADRADKPANTSRQTPGESAPARA